MIFWGSAAEEPDLPIVGRSGKLRIDGMEANVAHNVVNSLAELAYDRTHTDVVEIHHL